MRTTLVMLSIAVCLCSCVSKKSFELQVAATDSANQANAELRANNANLQKRIAGLEADLQQRTGEAQDCTAQLNAANEDLKRYESDQQRLESVLGDTRQGATQAADSCQKRIARLQAAMATLQKQADSDRVACQARLAGIKNTCDQLTASLDQERGEAAARADGLQQDLDQCNGLRQNLERQGNACRQQLADANAAREDLQGRFAVLQDEHQAAEAAVAKRQAALEAVAARLRSGLQQAIDGGKLSVAEGEGRVTVRFGFNAHFAGNEADLKPAGEALLGQIGKLLQGAKGLEVDIEGHGARMPVSKELKKGVSSGWELVTARAVKVMQSLRLQSKIPAGRLAIVDFGPAPVLPTAGGEAREAGAGHIDIVLLPLREPAEPSASVTNPGSP